MVPSMTLLGIFHVGLILLTFYWVVRSAERPSRVIWILLVSFVLQLVMLAVFVVLGMRAGS